MIKLSYDNIINHNLYHLYKKYDLLLENYDENIYFWNDTSNIKKNMNFELLNANKNINININTNKKIGVISINKTNNKHINLPIEYYNNALSNLNINFLEYEINLFGDKNINFENFVVVNNICCDSFYELYDYDIIICDNSEYSLFIYYLNEIFYNKKITFIMPDVWTLEPTYYIYDFIKNDININLFCVYKCAVILFHKNILNIYNKYWIDKCIDSILNQTYQNFDIYEINYGDEKISFLDEFNTKNKNIYFYTKKYITHTEAMTFLLNECFKKNYDIVFNTNLDDYYNENRFIYQIFEALNGNLISSCLFNYIEESEEIIRKDIEYSKGNNYLIYKNNDFIWVNNKNFVFDKNTYSENIKYEIIKKHLFDKDNVINHSGVCFTKKFWYSKNKYNIFLRYRNDKPYEDLSLWYRALINDVKISIVNKNLIHYRIHNNQICSKKKNIEEHKLYDIEFKSEPDLSNYNIGILLEIYNEKDINVINITNKNIFENKPKFYFFYVNIKIIEVLNLYLKNNKINNYIIQINDSDYMDFCPYNIIECFDVSIEINCDFLIYIEDHYIPKINNLKELNTYKKYISKNIL